MTVARDLTRERRGPCNRNRAASRACCRGRVSAGSEPIVRRTRWHAGAPSAAGWRMSPSTRRLPTGRYPRVASRSVPRCSGRRRPPNDRNAVTLTVSCAQSSCRSLFILGAVCPSAPISCARQGNAPNPDAARRSTVSARARSPVRMWHTVVHMETSYERPEDYDLEHEGDDEDIAFYTHLLERWRPRRIMELAAGTGRVTIPLARAAASAEIEIVGLERDGPMLEEARRKLAELNQRERSCLTLMPGD